VFDALEDIVRRCPDELWTRRQGGYIFWQQIYHLLVNAGTYALGQTAPSPLYPEAVQFLNEDAPDTLSKERLLAFMGDTRKALDAYLAALPDDELSKRHEVRSKRLGRDVTVLEAFFQMSGHFYYHIGASDAMLRDIGVKGAM
ncbi:MAG: DinB family protein, partial [Desulfovibrio sp.]|nr:DinB family protein [Desulfovibrio sp.]